MALEIIKAPFTDKQVDALNRFQTQAGLRLHDYTCCNIERHTVARPQLVATHEGWVCSDTECNYTQDWAHAIIADESLVSPLHALLRRITGSGEP